MGILRRGKPAPRFFGAEAGPEDQPRLQTQLDFIKRLMLDGKQRTLPEICQAWQARTGRGMLETSASAALRSLRRPVHGGYEVTRQQIDTGLYGYTVRRKFIGEN